MVNFTVHLKMAEHDCIRLKVTAALVSSRLGVCLTLRHLTREHRPAANLLCFLERAAELRGAAAEL